MAQAASPAKPQEAQKGAGKWLMSLAALSLLAIVTGGLVGMSLISTVEKAVEEKKKGDEEKAPKPLLYSGNLVMKPVPSVLANLRNSGEMWIRLESSVIFTNGAVQNPDVMVSEIRQDIMAYLRTLSVDQIQGPSGLLHMREDLNERALLRSKGLIRELVVESLIVQ